MNPGHTAGTLICKLKKAWEGDKKEEDNMVVSGDYNTCWTSVSPFRSVQRLETISSSIFLIGTALMLQTPCANRG